MPGKPLIVVNLPETLAFAEAYAVCLGVSLPKQICQDADCDYVRTWEDWEGSFLA